MRTTSGGTAFVSCLGGDTGRVVKPGHRYDRRHLGRERIIYNPSLDVVTIDLETDKYCDVKGNKIYGSVTLQPFESKILISSGFEIPDPLIETELNKYLKVR